jgi:Reverse transcriptase (RNA-dependent DNA polymerase)
LNQFGFKPKGSTAVCTSLVKETISYYRLQCNDVYSVFLDASKAFDRVKYSKLFCCLFARKIPAVFIRLLFSLYKNHMACVLWNGVYSSRFPVHNGVKQGGILSPVLFCVYIDGLLNRLADCHVGCYIGSNFLGALAYADDIVLLAPTPSAIRKLLHICDVYAREYSIIFNGKKSKCIFFPGLCNNSQGAGAHFLPSLQVGDNDIEYVDSWSHLGHILSSDSRDNLDIEHRRVQTVKQINDVLCYFGKLDSTIKLQLLYSYCSSMYGSELWDLTCSAIEAFGVSWRRALKNIWKLPMNTHNNVLYALSGVLPIDVELSRRAFNLVLKCINSDNSLVRSVTRHVISLSGCQSPIGKNFITCCQIFGLRVNVPDHCFNLCYNQTLYNSSNWSRFINVSISAVTQLFELIMIRDGVWRQYSDNFVDGKLSNEEIRSIIYYICTA